MFLDLIRHLFPGREERIAIIIHGSSIEAGGVGLTTAQIPGDRFVIGAVQINMVISLAAEYGVSIDESAALALISSALASMIGVEVANGLIKYVPGIGNISNMATAVSITQTIGWATKSHYDKQN